jgi:hypothetical protein
MHRPSAQDFLLTVLQSLEDLPPDLARRLAEIAAQPGVERAQAIRQLFEELVGD